VAAAARDVTKYIKTPAAPVTSHVVSIQTQSLDSVANTEQIKKTATALSTKTFAAPEEELHVALVKIRNVQNIPDSTLHGVGKTLGQLRRLGLLAIVVVDEPAIGANWRAEAESQAERITIAIEASRGEARRVDGAITTSANLMTVSAPQLLLSPLSRGVIPIVTPVAFDASLKMVSVDANDIVLSLATLFSRNTPVIRPVSLDRIIYLDPLGGIPARDRPAGAHVFVNMQQEYPSIASELSSEGHTDHLKALDTLRSCLSLLPSTTSAIVTTPAAAAHAKLPERSRSKNPLIHNLLTDKPTFSSSLPTANSPATQTTLVKHGIPLKLFPPGTKLTSPEINLPKLVELIEDSFGKRLDVEHYLSRVNDRIAGLMIAGNYEGAAIVTWETPPGNPMTKQVCYLDKFAVAKRSQGAGGVADVVFKAMVVGVGPGGLFESAEGLVWRSRRRNPVNKWVSLRLSLYFSPS
jgi:amino-acid N-acetyltransferase